MRCQSHESSSRARATFPIIQEGYDDAVEFNTSLGSFFLPVRAFLPELSMVVPPTLDFGYCPVNEVTEQTIEINNNGQIPAEYEWKAEAPFVLEPARGRLESGQKQTVTVRFSPKVLVRC